MWDVQQNTFWTETEDDGQTSEPLSQNVHRADTHEAVIPTHRDSEYQ